MLIVFKVLKYFPYTPTSYYRSLMDEITRQSRGYIYAVRVK